MGVSPEVGMGAIRFSLGRTTTVEELERVIQLLKNIVPSLPTVHNSGLLFKKDGMVCE
jgi:cysteine sulfinate desulfinase/cysteine desulfurase-like protein